MKRRLAMESLEPKCLLAGLVIQGTDGADVFEFTSDTIRVNGVEQAYDPAENPVVTIDGLAGTATETVNLTGSLSQTGDVATAARRIQTGVLGDGCYSAPPSSGTLSNAQWPSITNVTTTSRSGGTALEAGDTHEYKLVWGDDYALGTPTPTESRPSETFSQAVGADGDEIVLSNLPTAPPTNSYTHLRVYRRTGAGTDFNYVGQVSAGTTTFHDSASDAVAAGNPILDETVISGNYSYAITYVAGDGTESRPGPLSGPINVTNGRVTLDNLPQADTGATEWRTRRIYRSLATDSETFHLVGEIPNMDGDVMFVDNFTDAEISTNPTLDCDGPKIGYSTRLVDVVSRDGWNCHSVFEEGTIQLTATKGGHSLETREFQVTSETTVQDLIDIVTSSAGILPASADPANPIPGSSDSYSSSTIPPGGRVEGGRIILTSNNGPGSAIEIDLPGLSCTQLQGATGEGTATDLIVFDDQGSTHQILLTTALEARDATTTTYRWFAEGSTGLVSFDASGDVVATTNMTVTLSDSFSFDLDFSGVGVGESNLAAAQDSIVLHGSNGNETVVIQPGSAAFTSSAFEVHVTHIPDITVVGGGGIDVAELIDSPLDDHLVAAPDGATLSGPAYRSRVEGFRTVHGYSKSGGIDVAELFDGEGDDRFIATPTYGRLVLGTQSPGSQGLLRAKFFDYVHAYAKQGGRDAAYLADSAGDDVFVRTDTIGKLRGEGFLNRAKYFESVSAVASTGNDLARLVAPGDTHFLASGVQASLSGAVSGAAYHFDWVRAISTDSSNTRDLEAIAYQLALYGPWS
jgi:hypothetical protein